MVFPFFVVKVRANPSINPDGFQPPVISAFGVTNSDRD